jgi:hypothetical protein
VRYPSFRRSENTELPDKVPLLAAQGLSTFPEVALLASESFPIVCCSPVQRRSPMPHITLPDGLPGIRGAMAFRPETAKSLNELADILLFGPTR